MKKIINYILVCLFCSANIQAQSISSSVLASTGGLFANGNGSISFTIGETNTESLATGNQLLTQGFQQSNKLVINLKAYLQGYYRTGGTLANVLFNQGVVGEASNECDTVNIEFRKATAPYDLVLSTSKVLQTNGQLVWDGITLGGQPYYIVLKHRSSIETWSASPVYLDENTTYDFTAGAQKAYGDNQIEMETGKWAIYAADLDHDGNITLDDYSLWETSNNNFDFGYYATDLDGDGNVTLDDYTIWETNNNNFVSAIIPY